MSDSISSNMINNLLIVNLDENLDDDYFLNLEEIILNQLRNKFVIGVVLDYSKVQILDYDLANKMLNLVEMIKLMGFESVITGLKPEVVMTLISLGLDNLEITTKLNLDLGINYIQNLQQPSLSTEDDVNLDEGNDIE
ncbi:MAG: STAS domain-containing protein [Cyclobacteriaceae bacterium]|nr:STAS domain-containing protein [Cyclobacteriaceae bacterium]